MIKITQSFSIFNEFREKVMFKDIEITFDLSNSVWEYTYLQQLTDILNCTKSYNVSTKEFETQKQLLRDAIIFKLPRVSFTLYTLLPEEIFKIEKKVQEINEKENENEK